jgi:hypothetical protein
MINVTTEEGPVPVSKNEPVKNNRLVGYVRVTDREDVFTSEQNSEIHGFAHREGLKVLHMEHEVSNGVQLMRVGLWKLLRKMVCLNCPPKQMPMSDMYDYWFKEAIRPCSCQSPSPSDGILAAGMEIICTTPAQGARFTLDMCANNKHVFAALEHRCLSCCNPQAVRFVANQGLGR